MYSQSEISLQPWCSLVVTSTTNFSFPILIFFGFSSLFVYFIISILHVSTRSVVQVQYFSLFDFVSDYYLFSYSIQTNLRQNYYLKWSEIAPQASFLKWPQPLHNWIFTSYSWLSVFLFIGLFYFYGLPPSWLWPSAIVSLLRLKWTTKTIRSYKAVTSEQSQYRTCAGS